MTAFGSRPDSGFGARRVEVVLSPSHDPVYIPATGEYIRPASKLVLRPGGRFDNHYVRGAQFHSSAFVGLRHCQK